MLRVKGNAVLVLALLAPAFADVDLEVRSGDKVSGTLNPGTEKETLSFALPGGAKVKAKASGTRKGPAVAVTLRDGGGAVRGTPVTKGRGATVALATAAGDSGVWRLEVVSADGSATGDYTASVVWTPLRKFGPTTTTLAADATAGLDFTGELGATVRVTAVGKGDARAQILGIAGPSGDLGGADDGVGGVKDTTPKLKLPVTGAYSVSVRNIGGAGDVVVTVKVTPPKASKRKVDVRAAKLGGTDGTAISRVLGPGGGTVEVPDLGLGGGLDDISGASVTVPPGALPSGIALLVANAPPFVAPGSETPLGPSVLFAPEGTTFREPVTVSIPVDLSLVGGNASAVRVFVRAASGRVSEVTLTPPDAFDFTTRPGFVSFPVSHFSSYRCATNLVPGFNPTTVAQVPAATKLAAALSSPIADAVFYVGVDDDGTGRVEVLSSPTTGIQYTSARYAGGGTQTADDTDRLAFDFRGGVTALVEDSDGTLYVGTSTRVFSIAPTGEVRRIAGTGIPGDTGDAGPATSAQIRSCVALAVDPNGGLLLADNVSARIRRIDAAGDISTEFGTGTAALGSDADPPDQTTLLDPAAIIPDPLQDAFLVCDAGRVRRLSRGASPKNETVAGAADGSVGSSGDGGTRLAARFRRLSSISAEFGATAFDAVLVGDDQAHTIRRIQLGTDVVEAVVGIADTSGTSADGAPAPFAITGPRGVVAFVSTFVFFMEDDGNVRFYLTPVN